MVWLEPSSSGWSFDFTAPTDGKLYNRLLFNMAFDILLIPLILQRLPVVC